MISIIDFAFSIASLAFDEAETDEMKIILEERNRRDRFFTSLSFSSINFRCFSLVFNCNRSERKVS